MACAGVAIGFWWLRPSAFTADDAYFYLVIARGFPVEHSWTFNGIFTTNGVHPLWCALLSGWAAVVAAFDPDLLDSLHASLPLAAAVFLAATWALRAAALAAGWHPAVVVVIPVVYCGVMGVLFSEAHVLLFASALLLGRAVCDRAFATPREAALTGAAAALTLLARLDAVFWVGALFALAFLWRPADRRRVLLAGAVIALLMAPYLVMNVVAFGGLMPVSGWLKSSFPHPIPGQTGRFGGLNVLWLGYNVPVGIAPIAVAAAALALSRRARGSLALASLTLGSLGHWIYTSLFATTAWYYWYFLIGVIGGAIGAFHLLEELAVRLRRDAAGLSLALGSVVAAAGLASLPLHRFGAEPGAAIGDSEVVRFIRQGDLEGATFVVSEAPGQLAFHLPRARFVATDLLTTSRTVYARVAAAENPFAELLRSCAEAGHPVTHVVWNTGSFLRWSRDLQRVEWIDPKHGHERSFGELTLGPPIEERAGLLVWRVDSDDRR